MSTCNIKVLRRKYSKTFKCFVRQSQSFFNISKKVFSSILYLYCEKCIVHILSMSTIWIYIMYYYEVYVMTGGPILKSIPDSAWELYFAQYFGMTLHSSEIFPTRYQLPC